MLVLAFGLVGTAFALVLVLLLLNDPAVVHETNPLPTNLGGLVVLVIASVLAACPRTYESAGGLDDSSLPSWSPSPVSSPSRRSD